MSGPRDYARIYRENSILTASPGQLILMLFDGAARSMAIAHAAFERPKNDFRRFQVITRAQGEFTRIPKGELNPFKSNYAGFLTWCVSLCCIVAANGLAISQFITQNELGGLPKDVPFALVGPVH